MTQAIQKRESGVSAIAKQTGNSPEYVQTIKDAFAKGATDLELQLFLETAKRTGLNPMARQIYCIQRYSNGVKTMSTQVSIDGFRLIADRTNCYVPGRESTFTFDENGNVESATAYIKKLVGGIWHEVSATAFYAEYVQTTKEGQPNSMWRKMPRLMLNKCFDDKTEVLTDKGFQKFSEVTGRVLQVTPDGLEPTNAKPFVQDYDGEMIFHGGSALNFCVTPNHDMLTTDGKIEAGQMFEQARARAKFYIPRCIPLKLEGNQYLCDEQIKLAAAFLADGSKMSESSFKIEVSRPYKVEFLRELGIYVKERLVNAAGASTYTNPRFAHQRIINTISDKACFTYEFSLIKWLCRPNKSINTAAILALSQDQARILVDAWVLFDGHRQKKTGVRRFYSSRIEHIEAFELACVVAGYSVSPRRSRTSDISEKPNYFVTISDRRDIPVFRWERAYHNLEGKGTRKHTGLVKTQNTSGKVWCVTVPSGVIVVRRNGFSMLCGNCAESLVLRKAFPAELSGLYTVEEMGNADADEVTAPPPQTVQPEARFVQPSETAAPDVIEGEIVEERKTGASATRDEIENLLNALGIDPALALEKYDKIAPGNGARKAEFAHNVRVKFIKDKIASDDWTLSEDGTTAFLAESGIEGIDNAKPEQIADCVRRIRAMDDAPF